MARVGRLELSRRYAADKGVQVPGYLAADFDRMLRETKPDLVIVTTVDATQDDYIVRALEGGCGAITEKPMTTTAEKCQRILDARRRTGKKVRVTFNYRYSPPRTQDKDLLMNGAIGDVLSVDFHWLINTVYGADYFRRWHSQKRHPGGLMRGSDERGGAASILIGVAANRGFETGQAVKVADLVSGFTPPDYPPMPTREQPVPMPPRRARG